MNLVNQTPFSAKLFRGEPTPNILLCTLVAKLGYRLTDDSRLVDDSDDIDISDSTRETPLGILPSEQLPYKQGADVFILGHAYAPDNRPTSEMAVRFELGSFRRDVSVFGDRVWLPSLVPSNPEPFVKMPLTYANAFGGVASTGDDEVPYPDNPVGKGFVLEEKCAAGTSLPNIEFPESLLKQWQQQPMPASYAPLPARSRLHFQRSIETLDPQSLAYRITPKVFSVAHPKMILDGLTTGSLCRISGMHPDRALQFVFPEVHLLADFELGKNRYHQPLVCDTLAIFADEWRIEVSARTSFRYRLDGSPLTEIRLKQ